eukprot:8534710-Lingulodinium_polyedra.AAC.1
MSRPARDRNWPQAGHVQPARARAAPTARTGLVGRNCSGRSIYGKRRLQTNSIMPKSARSSHTAAAQTSMGWAEMGNVGSASWIARHKVVDV